MIRRIVFGKSKAIKLEKGTPVLKMICDNQRKLNPEIDSHLKKVEENKEAGLTKFGNDYRGNVISLLDGSVIE